jgi:hypothetical protein
LCCRYKAKVEEGLSRLLAFLRDEEERERLEEIERLKPIGTPVGAYLEYRCGPTCLAFDDSVNEMYTHSCGSARVLQHRAGIWALILVVTVFLMYSNQNKQHQR